MSAALIAGGLIFGIGLTEARTKVSGLDISLEDGRLTMDVRDASSSRVLRAIAAEGGFALDIAGQLDSRVSASFENVPIERALRRIVGRSSYIIELTQSTDAGAPRRIGKLYIFARGAPERVKTSGRPATKPTIRRTSRATKSKRGKSSATKNKR